jgi:hypothetical protein
MICNHLPSKNRLNENASVVAFCLQKYEYAKKILPSTPKTNEANYCKGYMYWKGWGYVQDLEYAKNYMKEAGDSEAAERARQAIQEMIDIPKSNKSYDKNQDLSRTTTSSPPSSSSCSCVGLIILGLTCYSTMSREMHALVRREMMQSECGRTLVREYYRTGKQLIDCFNSGSVADEDCESVRHELLSRTLPLLHEGNDVQAIRSMFDMQFSLCRKYGITISPDVVEILRNDQRYSLNLDEIESILCEKNTTDIQS